MHPVPAVHQHVRDGQRLVALIPCNGLLQERYRCRRAARVPVHIAPEPRALEDVLPLPTPASARQNAVVDLIRFAPLLYLAGGVADGLSMSGEEHARARSKRGRVKRPDLKLGAGVT